ncbi:MAG: hypothetical protein LBP42_03295, partial [Treponema sp.]|nr:hypothetical protein [Treponema sp.]
MKIGNKLIIMIIGLNLIGAGILVGTILRISQKELSTLVTNEVINLAGNNAQKIAIWLNKYMDAARTAANFMEQYQEIESSQRRNLYNLLVRTLLEANPETAAAGSCWEPNALDGMDRQYASTPGTDDSGRFIPYWSRTSRGISLSSLTAYETSGAGNYYVIAKQTGQETLIEPYWYNIDGKDQLITSITAPIKNQGRFVGAMIIDISIDIIQKQVQEIVPYEGSIAAVFSNGGLVSGHFDPARIGKSMMETEQDTIGSYLPELIDAIRSGRQYTFINTIPEKGTMQFFCVPITVGTTTTPWSLMIGIPTHITNTPIYRMLIISAVISGVMVILITLAAVLMARSLSRPLARMVTVLKDVGTGDL